MKTLSDHVLDIVQNSIRANATLIEIIVEENKKNDICILRITDNGCGMDAETLEQATNPFFTTRKTRKVGMGLSLLKQNAEMANGKLNIRSEPEKGTVVEAYFQLSHIDKPELGDIWNTFYLTILSNTKTEFIYEHVTEKGCFRISSADIQKNIEGVSMNQPEIREAITCLIKNNINEIQ